MARDDSASAQIEDLEARIASLDADLVPLRQQMSNIDKTRARYAKEIAALKKDMNRKKQPPRISDHAVIRFLERRHGFTFDHVREELLTPTVIQAMEMGAEGVRIEGGTLKITDKTVTTFIASGGQQT